MQGSKQQISLVKRIIFWSCPNCYLWHPNSHSPSKISFWDMFQRILVKMMSSQLSIQIKACLFKHHFYRRSHSKMASKEHCMCIKQKQNIFCRKAFCAALRPLSHLFNLYAIICNFVLMKTTL